MLVIFILALSPFTISSAPWQHRQSITTVMRVGGRNLAPQYYSASRCTSTEFLTSLSIARIRDDGASRAIDRIVRDGIGNTTESLTLPHFEYSFDLQGCAKPHVFTSEEACDLVQSFGGLFLKGDSMVRHLHTALMMLLRDRIDGGLIDTEMRQQRCHYEGMFFDGRACYIHHQPDSQATEHPVCNGNICLYYDFAHISPESPLTHYETYSSLLPTSKRLRSTLFLQSVGLHFACALPPAIAYLHAAVGYFAQQHIPRAINLWMGLHAPGENKNVKYRATQGRDSVKRLNEGMSEEVDALAAGEEEMVRGALRSFDWYNATEGAESFDGTHYSYQVNMEKAQILLNLLDLIWGETVARGGLVRNASEMSGEESGVAH